MSEYYYIKQQFILCCASSIERMNQTLNELKEHFRDKINSPRRCEQVKTIGQLLHVLEIRDVLSEDNVQPLRDIAQIVHINPQLLHKINEYERYHISRDFNNFYGHNARNASQSEPYQKMASNNPYSNLSDKKMKMIHETLIEKIGTYWRDLARKLKIRECEIDHIELTFLSLRSKAEQMLEIYKKKADTQKWFLVLCEALEKARRKDLAKELQDILLMNL